jgi:choline monooxygenase
MIFVNADPEAQPLLQWLADLPAQLGPHKPEDLVEVSDLLYTVRANWKILVENFIDAYHLGYLHSVSLGDGDFAKLRQWPSGRHWIMKRGLKPGFSDDNKILPVISGVPANFGAGGYWLFPNLAIYERATFWNTFHVIPVSAGKSLVHIRTRAMPSALERSNQGELTETELPRHIVHAKGVHALLRLELGDVHPLKSNNVMLEDIYACEAVQAGLEMRGAKIGPLSAWEESLTFFQQQVLDYVPASP